MPLLQQGPYQGGAATGRLGAGADGGDLGGRGDARRRRLRPFGPGTRRSGEGRGAEERLNTAPRGARRRRTNRGVRRHDSSRTEERRVGKEWVSTCRSRGSPLPTQKKQTPTR